jgi:hypothetical protein
MKVRLNASGLSDVRRMQRRIPRVYILADNDLDEHFRGHGSAAHSHIDRCRSRVDWILFGKVAGSGGWCPGKPETHPAVDRSLKPKPGGRVLVCEGVEIVCTFLFGVLTPSECSLPTSPQSI